MEIRIIVGVETFKSINFFFFQKGVDKMEKEFLLYSLREFNLIIIIHRDILEAKNRRILCCRLKKTSTLGKMQLNKQIFNMTQKRNDYEVNKTKKKKVSKSVKYFQLIDM